MTNPQRITPVLVCEGQLSQRPMPLVLELSHAHTRDEKSCDSPAGNSLQNAANSLLALINSLFGAN
jgi:hypothetical protein